MSLKEFIVTKSLELDKKITGGYNKLPVVYDSRGFLTEIKKGNVVFFKKPSEKEVINYINETTQEITDEIISRTGHINQPEHIHEAKELLSKEIEVGLFALVYPKKKSFEQKILRGKYQQSARHLPLQRICGTSKDIEEDPYYERYTIIYHGFAYYILNFRHYI